MRIFLDDDRNPPVGEDWVVVRSVEALKDLVARHEDEVEAISFDNDLRLRLEGHHAITWLIDMRVVRPTALPALRRLVVHSANSARWPGMLSDMESARRHGHLPADLVIEHRPASGRLYPIATEDPREIAIHGTDITTTPLQEPRP